MVDNLHPETGERLTARTNAFRRVGYDFTVSLNKSASIVRAFAGEELGRQLDAARDRRHRRDDGGSRSRHAVPGAEGWRATTTITTGNMAWAVFHHTHRRGRCRASRPT